MTCLGPSLRAPFSSSRHTILFRADKSDLSFNVIGEQPFDYASGQGLGRHPFGNRPQDILSAC